MKITDIRMMRLWGPRNHSVGGGIAKVAKVIVRVDTDAGIYGLGEVDDFMGVRQGIAYMNEYFRGYDAFAANAIVSELIYGTQAPNPPGVRRGPMGPNNINAVSYCSPTATSWGPVLWAASGVEIALTDLIGKMLKTPAYNLLGGRFRPAARVYLDRSSPDNITDVGAWEKMAAETASLGFSQMKFDIDFMATECVGDVWNRTINLKQINRVVERLEAVRRGAGPDFEICADCHMQYNVPDAIRVAKALEHLNLLWLEDPTPHINPDSCAQVRSRTTVPICIGEMFNVEQFRLFIDAGACDILHPNIIFCGGMREMQRISQLADVHHMPVAYHGNGGAIATIAAANVGATCRNFLGVEYHFIETDWIGEIVRRDVPLFRDGQVPLSDAPGLGIELNSDVCAKHLAPGESLFD
jgi:galactonate dehydratase